MITLNFEQCHIVSGGLNLISQKDGLVALLSPGDFFQYSNSANVCSISFTLNEGCLVWLGHFSDTTLYCPLGNSGTVSFGNTKIDFGYNSNGQAYFNVFNV